MSFIYDLLCQFGCDDFVGAVDTMNGSVYGLYCFFYGVLHVLVVMEII